MVGILAIVGPSITAGAKVAEFLAEPIKSQYNYLFRYKRNIEKLKNEARTLENMRAGVKLLVDEAERNLKIIGLEVEEWLRRVDEIQKETELVLLNADKVENTRWLAYSLSKKAVKKTKVIVELQGKGKFDHVSYNPPPPVVTGPTPLNSSEELESRLSTMKDVMDALKEEDIRLIGIYGMGGVGKTTMVNDIAAKVIDGGLFDVVAKAEVTQSPDLKSIQGSIADFLGLKFGEEGLLARAALLRDMLLKGRRRVLVILDNIWWTLDLDKLGIPPVGNRFTILLTTRNADLCQEMGVTSIFKIEPLPHKEAWVLFQKTADKSCHTSASWRDEFQGVAQDIVKECQGWPLAIVTIAKALGSKTQMFMWENALQCLKNADFESEYKAMYSALWVSYECLESDVFKHLFLLCCLFPHGYDIQAEDLLRFGSGLRLFTEMNTVHKTRTRAKACIQKLKNQSLLLDRKDEECVRMHDVVHTFAMIVASRQEHLLVKHNDVTFRPRGDVEKISLWCEEMHALVAGLEFTKLNLLLQVGSGSSDMLQFPQNFYEGMGQLKVLIHRGMIIQSLPTSFERLTTVQTLSLDYCYFGKECDLSIIGKLVNLEILSFVHSDVITIPVELRSLARLRLLDMTGCVELLDIASGVLHSLIKLEELYLRGTLLNWPNEQINARLGELSSLPHLTAVEIELPSSMVWYLPNNNYEKLTRFRSCLSFAIESQVFRNALKLVGYPIYALFRRAEILHLDGSHGTYDFLSMFSTNSLSTYSLNSSAENFARTGWEATGDFGMLESLYLHDLHNLIEVWSIRDSWMSHAQQQPFGKLCALDISGCSDLKYVFPQSTARALVNLESVRILKCQELEEIFRSEDKEVGIKIELPKLKLLRLEDLRKLACFCKEVDAVVLPELVDLELLKLPNFTLTRLTISSDTESERHASSNHLFSKQKGIGNISSLRIKSSAEEEQLYLDQSETSHVSDSWICHVQRESFGNVRVLDISDCPGLKYAISLSTARALVNLETVRISGCRKLEEIFWNIDETVGVKIELPKLKWLKLRNLPLLACLCKKANAVVLPQLVDLELRWLPNFTFTVHASPNHIFSREKIDLGRETEVSDTSKKSKEVESDIPLTTLYHAKSALLIQISQCVQVIDIDDCDLVDVVFDLEALISGGNKAVVLNNLRVFDTFEGFKNLTTLSLLTCEKIKFFFSVVIANSLLQLQELIIKNCINMEEVVKEENGMEMGENARSKIIFPSLKSIELYDLPSLRFLCSGSHVEFEWPLLESLRMSCCDNVSAFTAGNSSTPRLQKIDIDFFKYSILGDINSTLWSARAMPVYKSMIASSSGSHK